MRAIGSGDDGDIIAGCGWAPFLGGVQTWTVGFALESSTFDPREQMLSLRLAIAKLAAPSLRGLPMCDECDDVDVSEVFDPTVRRWLAEATRDIEADLPGDRIPEEVWPIFFGEETGALAWPHHERMARCWEAATVLLSATSSGERPLG